MKIIKGFLVAGYALLCVTALTVGAMAGYYGHSIDNNYKVTKGTGFNIDTLIPVTAEYNGCEVSQCNEINSVGKTIEVDVKLLGIIPVKKTNVEIVEETYVAVLGSPFGIKMYTDGVLVVDTQSIETAEGNKNPAEEAGIKKGDYIISVDGQTVTTNEDIAEIVNGCDGKNLTVRFKRKEQYFTVTLCPALSKDDSIYRAGIWVKDSSAGIGTLTFYSPYNNMVCGLGHGVYDSETNTVINFRKGSLVGAEILSVVRGKKGVPGELKGKLTYSSIGTLYGNCINGVYGQAICNVDTTNLTQVAYKQEIKDGNATVICTVDGEGPMGYSCQIKLGTINVNDTQQDMMVIITDKNLIEKTGGIVQGMSGSPIIQNGKLVGAVTHVLIDDPTKGYAIFAENMLETAQSVSESNKLKDAS
jgi:stage IV sporulation protein B